MMLKHWICVILPPIAALASLPVTASTTLIVKGPPKVAAALISGDTNAIETLQSEGKIGSITSGLSLAQLHYDLPEVIEVAHKCQKVTLEKKSDGWATEAAYCSQFGRAAALGLGDAHEFVDVADFVQRVLIPVLTEQTHEQVKFDNGLDNANLAELARSTPALTLSWRGDRQTLPTVESKELNDELAIRIRIDGVASVAQIRPSGGLRAPITVVIPKAEFRTEYTRLGLKPVVDQVESIDFSGKLGSGMASLMLAPDVEIGPLSLRNLGVEVIQSSEIPPGVYIGMSLLRRFGGVAVSERAVTLSKLPLTECSKTTPMTFASDWSEHGVLQFPATLNGHALLASWAPGMTTELMVDPATLASAVDAGAGGFTQKRSTGKRTISIQVGDTVLHASSAYTPPVWNDPYQVKIGGTFLQSHSVQLRFGGQQPEISFCSDLSDNAHAQSKSQ